MISEAYFSNLATLRKAASRADLALISTRIAATKQPVAMVAAMVPRGGQVEVVPFGYLDTPGAVDAEARLTPAANAEFKKLLMRLKSEKAPAQFIEDSQGHVRVGFGPANKVSPQQCLLVLAWDNPYELFEDPTQ